MQSGGIDAKLTSTCKMLVMATASAQMNLTKVLPPKIRTKRNYTTLHTRRSCRSGWALHYHGDAFATI